MTNTYVNRLLTEKFKELDGLVINEIDDGDGNITYEYPEVAFPNEPFERPEDGYWYELHPTPAQPVQLELGSTARSRWTGAMYINICVPKNSGTEPLYDRYDNIAKLFRQGMIIKGVRIVAVQDSSSVDDGDFLVMPISIVWQADLER